MSLLGYKDGEPVLQRRFLPVLHRPFGLLIPKSSHPTRRNYRYIRYFFLPGAWTPLTVKISNKNNLTMRLPSVLALLSLAASAAADCAIMTGDRGNFNGLDDFYTKTMQICEKTLVGTPGFPCTVGHALTWRLICHGVAASSTSGADQSINWDKKPGDACGLAPGETCD